MIQEIIKSIEGLSGQYSGYEIFSDWIKSTAIAISNSCNVFQDEIYKKREREYIELAKKHGENMNVFAEMTGMLAIALENNMEDVLGKIYMAAGLGSKQTGQFFTPFHVSVATAEVVIPKKVSEKDPYIMYEPSSGGGGMIIAAAKVIKDRGLNYQKCMKVVAQDLDWKGVYMTYVQLSLLGIEATVVQGDSLQQKNPTPEQKFYTPRKVGII